MASDRAAARDIAEARMRGDLPPEVDVNDSSKLINPHVPEFMAKAPWYLSKNEGPTLSHQRLQSNGLMDQSMTAMEPLYHRGQKTARVATTFRAGACRNCGAMTHQARDCMERPRKVGAWKTGEGIAADEIAAPVVAMGAKLGWDAKRDKYAGYDAAEQVAKAVEVYTEAEAMRTAHLAAQAERLERERTEARAARRAAKRASRKSKAESAGGGEGKEGGEPRVKKGGEDDATASEAGGDTDASSFSEGGEEDGGGRTFPKTAEEELRLGSSAAAALPTGTQAQMSGWNMRSRENTAKYLLNLDPDSAFYDPKTRSMRENPFKGTGKDPKGLLYKGDNAAMMSGDTVELKKAEMFAWEAYNATGDVDVHLQANPTQTEALRKQAAARQEAVAALLQQRLLSAYGDGGGSGSGSGSGSGAGDVPPTSHQHQQLPTELRMGDSSAYVEYGADGKPLVDPEVAAAAAAAAVAAAAAPPHTIAPRASGTPCTSFGPEDVLPGNHREIWGSWFHRRTQVWGYACCHCTVKQAYCTGEVGRKAVADGDREAEEAAAAKRKRARGEE